MDNINIHSYQIRWEPYEYMHECDQYEINNLEPIYHHLEDLISVKKISIYFNYNNKEYAIPFRMRYINDDCKLQPDYTWSCSALSENEKTSILNKIKVIFDSAANGDQPFSTYLIE